MATCVKSTFPVTHIVENVFYVGTALNFQNEL